MRASGLSYVRSSFLVSLVLSLSTASHVLAAGHLPDIRVIALLGALLMVPMTLVGRRRMSFRSALASMGVGQLLLHILFGMTAVPAVCRTSSAMPGHHAAFELACSPAVQSPMDAASNGFTMVLMHGLASVILATALSGSDDAVALLRAWLAPALGVVPPAPALPALPRDLVAAVPAPTAPLPVHASVPTLRGPPSATERPLTARRG
jgi:hypothetical protein